MSQPFRVVKPQSGEMPIRGQSSAIKDVCDRAYQIAPTDCGVLIVGETGTGKGLIAHKIYHLSNRKDHPLIRINCATPPDSKLERDLLGLHQEDYRASTEAAILQLRELAGATILIDEISELSLESQAHLLEVLETIENENRFSDLDRIDIRLLVTSQHNLKKLVDENRFNKRLYYHISLFTLSIPPLRERGEDKQKIAEQLLSEACEKYHQPNKSFTEDALAAIEKHNWPGNYRELRNSVERAVLLSQSIQISARELDLEMHQDNQPDKNKDDFPSQLAESEAGQLDQGLSLEDYFQHFVLENQDQMTETELAQKLGISRKCLWERRQRFNIPRNKNTAK